MCRSRSYRLGTAGGVTTNSSLNWLHKAPAGECVEQVRFHLCKLTAVEGNTRTKIHLRSKHNFNLESNN